MRKDIENRPDDIERRLQALAFAPPTTPWRFDPEEGEAGPQTLGHGERRLRTAIMLERIIQAPGESAIVRGSVSGVRCSDGLQRP